MLKLSKEAERKLIEILSKISLSTLWGLTAKKEVDDAIDQLADQFTRDEELEYEERMGEET